MMTDHHVSELFRKPGFQKAIQKTPGQTQDVQKRRSPRPEAKKRAPRRIIFS
ncbi:MAG TPA: hypothetical protein DEB17_03245 [Chlorobaculum sp.]|jgi:hypothetical protein|uniref:Uncharacterized protein n=1 Tax=Chlorobaculum tepidum (strain ATCC 49652 / DSM 12025 / NBRC 103806 / TLS) TaxID=194439 RepID=Q8KE42_CHLTE|nr:hypothetical protein CT0848 [Chlorobaculum tepidum TLS]HBU23002.1 hypothetical protein [Chlorobaculum sp.]